MVTLKKARCHLNQQRSLSNGNDDCSSRFNVYDVYESGPPAHFISKSTGDSTKIKKPPELGAFLFWD
jgi:hypothetical protein